MAEDKEKQVHSGHRQRLKEHALAEGLDHYSSHQVLELLLFYAMPYKDTNELAHRLLDRYGSFGAVLNADYDDLLQVEGVGPNTASLLALFPEFFRRYQLDRQELRCRLETRAQLADYVTKLFIGCGYEVFYLICLDAQYNVLRACQVCQGTVNEVPIYPRLVVEAALRYRARSVVLAHNHPGGALRPTAADVQMTQQLAAVLEELDIKVLDHLIVSNDNYYSFVERGLMEGSGSKEKL